MMIYKVNATTHQIVDTWITDVMPIDSPTGFYFLWGKMHTTAMFQLNDDQHDVSDFILYSV